VEERQKGPNMCGVHMGRGVHTNCGREVPPRGHPRCVISILKIYIKTMVASLILLEESRVDIKITIVI
jgi:hypothetical protein